MSKISLETHTFRHVLFPECRHLGNSKVTSKHVSGVFGTAAGLILERLGIVRIFVHSQGTAVLLQVAKSLSNLASLLNDVERYEEAEKAYRASLSIREDALGETNVQV